jgi:hypothetical protein
LVFSSFIVSVGLLCFMLLIISLVFSSFIDHRIIWSSLLYLASEYLFGIFLFHWPSYHLVFFAWWLLIISLLFSNSFYSNITSYRQRSFYDNYQLHRGM